MNIEEALEKIEIIEKITEIEEIDLKDGLGRVLAEDLESPYDLPFFNRSPLDGFCFRAEDSGKGVILEVIDDIHAGFVSKKVVENGQAVRIMTGAKIPEGANAVCRLESVKIEGNKVTLDKKYEPFTNFIHKGEELRKGELIMEQDQELNAIHLGTLANLGISNIKVYRKAKIALISTGSELVSYDGKIEDGKIFNSNGIIFSQRLKELGFEAEINQQLEDDPKLLKEEFSKLADNFDLVISTGGVSVGDADYMEEVLSDIGGEKIFSEVSMKPGGHVKCYHKGKTAFLALSGNPFAALATFEIFARAILTKQTGKNLALKHRKAICQNEFPKKSRGRRIIRGNYDNGKVSFPDSHASSQISSAATCNALVDIPAGSDCLKEGDTVDLFLL